MILSFLNSQQPIKFIDYLYGLTQDCGNSSADALELPQSSTKPSQ